MSFEVEPISDTTFGARLTDLKLAAIDEATFADLYQTWLAYALLIFPGQHLSKDEQTAFARRFGEREFDLVLGPDRERAQRWHCAPRRRRRDSAAERQLRLASR